jgi:hypothetical protein
MISNSDSTLCPFPADAAGSAPYHPFHRTTGSGSFAGLDHGQVLLRARLISISDAQHLEEPAQGLRSSWQEGLKPAAR